VISVARAGPMPAISAKNRTNASAVHTTPRPTTDQATLAATDEGQWNAA
jgi:hypothetical protein